MVAVPSANDTSVTSKPPRADFLLTRHGKDFSVPSERPFGMDGDFL